MQHHRIVPTLTHGLLDHLVGIMMIVSPWVFDYHMLRGAAVIIPVVIGGAVMLNAVFTDFEMGLLKVLPLRHHFALDVALGLFLALSPWVLDFHDRIYLPHFLGGVVIAVLPLFSERKPFDESIYTEVVIKDGRAEIVRHARSSTDRSPR